MQTSTVVPQNDFAIITGESVNHDNTYQRRNMRLTPRRRDLRFFGIISAVILVLICAVSISASITLKRNKDNSQPTTTLAMTTEHSGTAIPISSSSSSDGMPITSVMGIMDLTISSFDTQTITSISKPVTDNVNVTLKTMIVNPPTQTSPINDDSKTNYSNSASSTIDTKVTGTSVLKTTAVNPLTRAASIDNDSKTKYSSSAALTIDTKATGTSVVKITSVNPSTRAASTENTSKTKHSSFPLWTSQMKTAVTSVAATTSTTTSVTSNPTITTVRRMIVLTRSSDTIIGLYNTTAGETVGGWNGTYHKASEMPHSAIDNLTSSKYLNFGGQNCSGCAAYKPGLGTGFIIIPSLSNATIAGALRFATANDIPNRDPITVTLEGSTISNIVALMQGSNWTLIYNGSTGINPTNSPGGETYGTQQIFSNTKPFASYRLLVTSKRGNSNSVQYSEAQIMGYI